MQHVREATRALGRPASLQTQSAGAGAGAVTPLPHDKPPRGRCKLKSAARRPGLPANPRSLLQGEVPSGSCRLQGSPNKPMTPVPDIGGSRHSELEPATRSH